MTDTDINISFESISNKRSHFIDLTGKVYNLLTVLGFAGTAPNGHSMWWCRCECGNVVQRMSKKLKSADQKSCGCLLTETRKTGKITHGDTSAPEYGIFLHARRRCEDPNNSGYPNYGGRGIKMLFKTYEEFIDHVGYRPSKDYSLDRIDNDGHYAPGNVRWATVRTQGGNKRTNCWITIDGTSNILADWARLSGIDPRVVWTRINKQGWCEACSVFNPPHSLCPHKLS